MHDEGGGEGSGKGKMGNYKLFWSLGQARPSFEARRGGRSGRNVLYQKHVKLAGECLCRERAANKHQSLLQQEAKRKVERRGTEEKNLVASEANPWNSN